MWLSNDVADLEQDALRGRVDPLAVPGEGAVLHDPDVAVQVREVHVDAVVSVEVGRERHRQEALLVARRRHVPGDVEERARQEPSAVPDADHAAAEHHVQVAAVPGHVRRLVEPRHHRVQPRRVGRGRRERRRSRQHTHQDPHPSRHGRHATPPWYGFCHGRHSHRVAGRVAGGRSRRGARAPRNRARVQGLASGGRPQDALQQPRSRGGRGPAAARRLRRLRAGGPESRGAEGDRRDAPSARGRRDAARPEREAGRRVPNPRRRPARASGQLAPRAPIRDLGRVPPARGRGAHDVRPDDGGVVDLHRHAGDPPGHLPDVRRGR